ncbi:AAA family ATPase [Streptococcus infantis]|uniref:AAA family ATPase n=1 Tax=Streptococcus infantis TaxID=68892 RepID=UPI0039E034EA
MFVGVRASRVRSLVEDAKKSSTQLLLIDELCLCSPTWCWSCGGNDARESTLNQLLIEMDGFEGK